MQHYKQFENSATIIT